MILASTTLADEVPISLKNLSTFLCHSDLKYSLYFLYELIYIYEIIIKERLGRPHHRCFLPKYFILGLKISNLKTNFPYLDRCDKYKYCLYCVSIPRRRGA